MPTANERRLAQQAALYAVRPRVRLLHCRPSGRALLALLALLDGSVKQLRVTTADAPEPDALTESERGRVRAAFLALHRQAGTP